MSSTIDAGLARIEARIRDRREQLRAAAPDVADFLELVRTVFPHATGVCRPHNAAGIEAPDPDEANLGPAFKPAAYYPRRADSDETASRSARSVHGAREPSKPRFGASRAGALFAGGTR